MTKKETQPTVLQKMMHHIERFGENMDMPDICGATVQLTVASAFSTNKKEQQVIDNEIERLAGLAVLRNCPMMFYDTLLETTENVEKQDGHVSPRIGEILKLAAVA